mmetsp:Transcript_44560/g.102896  ORF Transcript_44560/g.102896 Transcript_44560/m.102896 type:complete len:276 (-) Transcript_44560:104-931(-)
MIREYTPAIEATGPQSATLGRMSSMTAINFLSVFCLVLAGIDHSIFALLLLAGSQGMVSLRRCLTWTLTLSLASGLMRLSIKPGEIARRMHFAVLTLHCLHVVALFHVMEWHNMRSVLILIDILVGAIVLCLDLIHVLCAKETREETIFISMPHPKLCCIEEPPTVERFEMALDTEPPEISSHTCAICLEDVVVGNKLARLDCRHTFHSDCVDKWFRSVARPSPWCPYRCPPGYIARISRRSDVELLEFQEQGANELQDPQLENRFQPVQVIEDI